MQDVVEKKRDRLVSSVEELEALSADEFIRLVEKASPEELDSLLTISARRNTQRQGFFGIFQTLAPARILFDAPTGNRSVFSVIAWWEARRTVFNVVVGLVGLLSLNMMIGYYPRSTLWEGAFWYGIAANFCYTFGWMAELIARRMFGEKAEHLGAILFTLGTLFSVAVTLAPAVLLFISYTFHPF